MTDNKPKVAFVTGASSDIGVEICRLYMERGWNVLGHHNKGQDSFFQLAESSQRLTPVQIDFSAAGEIETFINENPGTIGKIDALVNAAAILEPAPFDEIDAAMILRHLTVNLVPGLLLMRALAPKMMARQWGRIVHLSSIGTKFRGGSSSFCYALSKHAVEFLPADFKKWAAHDVLANTLRVGVTDTQFHLNDENKDMTQRIALIPMGRMATTKEIAKQVIWLGSEENSFITGETITVAGGE